MQYIKKFGQNFLENNEALDKIAEALEIKKGEIIVEIGAGTGNLTKEILKRTKNIIAIEKDRKLIPELQKFSDGSDFKIIEGDCRDVLAGLTKNLENYKICGNIPYYLTGQLFRIIQELENLPLMIVFTIQKEVAERMTGENNENQLSIITKLWAQPEIIMNLKAENFYPKPKVDSSIIKLSVLPKKERIKKEKEVIEVVKIGFLSPRKTLFNNLSRKFGKDSLKIVFQEMNFPEKIRPHDLSVQMWINIAKILLDF